MGRRTSTEEAPELLNRALEKADEEVRKGKIAIEEAPEIAECLRCTTLKADEQTRKCEGCRYRTLERVSEKLPVPPDQVIDGVPYWESCDSDRMALDAAEALENLLKFVGHLQQ